jgi:hypothetical protein
MVLPGPPGGRVRRCRPTIHRRPLLTHEERAFVRLALTRSSPRFPLPLVGEGKYCTARARNSGGAVSHACMGASGRGCMGASGQRRCGRGRRPRAEARGCRTATQSPTCVGLPCPPCISVPGASRRRAVREGGFRAVPAAVSTAWGTTAWVEAPGVDAPATRHRHPPLTSPASAGRLRALVAAASAAVTPQPPPGSCRGPWRRTWRCRHGGGGWLP